MAAPKGKSSTKSKGASTGPTQGGRQYYERTGTAPTPANTGAAGKSTTPKTY